MTIKPLCSFIILGALPISLPAMSDVLKEATGSLTFKNFYFNRDFRDGFPSQPKREEWAQGFHLNLQSGFTEGSFGVGLDATAMLGLALDSGSGRTGTGLLQRDADNHVEDTYSKMLLTAKARFARTELRYGGLSPQLPLLASNASRLFPQYFNGGLVTSKDVEHFTFHAGRVTRVKLRDSTDSEQLTTMTQSGAYPGSTTSDSYYFGGLDYQPSKNLTVSAHMGELEDMYLRRFLGVIYNREVGRGSAFAELRYFDAKEVGQRLAGDVHNRVISSNVGYQWGGHRWSGGYQKVSGDTAYAYVGGTDTYLFSEQQAYTFALQDERAWHARYDYNFAALGIPGLTFNVRYVKGDMVDPEAVRTPKAALLRERNATGTEWERTTDLAYTLQSGPLKDLSLRWRNSTARSNLQDGVDENRVIISYGYSF